MDFQTFKDYRRLVRRDMAKPLLHECNNEYVLRVTEDGDPVLFCAFCNVLVQPGIRMWNDIRAVVKEHYDV